MSNLNNTIFHKQVSAAGLLIAMGIVFGDIGTSPLYTYTSIFHEGEIINATKAVGVLSSVFWTLLLLTSVKYIFIVLKADNNGEGGIFSLYAQVRRYFGKWLAFPAIFGAAFLIADGVITPPISVASAIEGLEKFKPGLNTVPWVIGILVVLFLFQQIGAGKIGKVFGPLMLVWFSFIGIIGILGINGNWAILKALNPTYAFYLIKDYPNGFWMLGGIFLCSTGAEALYSDMGHVGRNNIRWSWLYIKACLVLSYAGQTAWLVAHQGEVMGNISPFYNTIPTSIYIFTVGIATLATIIASQALISGCFTLVNEGIRLNFWPRHKVFFPSHIKGQIYIPFVNWFLMIACISMVLYFKKSTNMEAAFGLSVTLTMLVTSFLMVMYLLTKRVPIVWVLLFGLIFFTIEGMFLIANLSKLMHGGWITLLIGLVLSFIMYIWYKGKQEQNKLMLYTPLAQQIPILQQLIHDPAITKYATHLVYLSSSNNEKYIEQKSINSILNAPIKKADVYWFVHINVSDEPFTEEYKVNIVAPNNIYHLTFNIGFRIEPRVDMFFRFVIQELIDSKELVLDNSEELKYCLSHIGDYKFLLEDSFLSYENSLPKWESLLLILYYKLKNIAVREEENFGLEQNNVWIEKYPLIISAAKKVSLKRQFD
jgi:KUP system potassium uptake protein